MPRTLIGLIAFRGFVMMSVLVASGLFALLANAEEPGTTESSKEAVAPADFSLPHLPSDKIAEVFRASESVGGTDQDSHSKNQVEGSQRGEEDSIESSVDPVETEITKWVSRLSSPEFATREQASTRLREIGKPAIARLRQTASEHPDLEVRLRAQDVARGILSGETAGRIDAFLAGGDVPLDGWSVAQRILGDGVRIRELFVDLLMRHPDVASSLDAATEQRQAAFRATIVRIQRGMFVEGRLPTEADVLALMLLANDRDIEIRRVEEEALLSILRRSATNALLSDAQLSGPARAILGGWVSREDVINREAMLWLALTWDLTEAFPLAKSTLEKSTNPMTLAMAMLAIARFGDQSNLPEIAKFLDDQRPAGEQQFNTDGMVQVQLRDVAAATIVVLSDRKLIDFGMSERATHPKYGFNIRELGFPDEDPQPRKDVIEKVRKELLLEGGN